MCNDLKSIIFWDMTACSPLKVNRDFREHVASIFRDEEISSSKNIKQAGGQHLLATCLLAGFF
jgi:hypothetical protein